MTTRSRSGSRRIAAANRQFQHLGRIIPEVAGRALRRKGYARARVIVDWAEIVGRDLAGYCRPLKISRSVLTLRVTPSQALMVQHMEPVILDRIASFYGDSNGSIISRLKLEQGPLEESRPQSRKPLRALTAGETAHLERLVDTVDDPALRKALLGLGKAVMASGPRRTAREEDAD